MRSLFEVELPASLEILKRTPVEVHEGVRVKREDLCCPAPGPPFSKMRGVIRHLASRPEQAFGVLDTFHSKAGWAVAYAARLLGKECLNFYPQYKDDEPGTLRYPQEKAQEQGARIVPLLAGRSAVLYYTARKALAGSGAYLVPNALKLDESAEETAIEVTRTDWTDVHTVIISASSGTIASGVLRGLERLRLRPKIIIHMGYHRSETMLLRYLHGMAPGFPLERVTLVNEGYGYTEQARGGLVAPFPCNEFYDLKAWQWLMGNPRRNQSYLFWNVGA